MNLDAWGVARGAFYTLSTYTRIDVWGRIGRETTHGHWQANESLTFWHETTEPDAIPGPGCCSGVVAGWETSLIYQQSAWEQMGDLCHGHRHP